MRRNITFTPEQWRAVQEAALTLGISANEYVRRCVNEALGPLPSPEWGDWARARGKRWPQEPEEDKPIT